MVTQSYSGAWLLDGIPLMPGELVDLWASAIDCDPKWFGGEIGVSAEGLVYLWFGQSVHLPIMTVPLAAGMKMRRR
jgi:hypothetical protein